MANSSWAAVVIRLREAGMPMPNLDEYDLAALQGPAIWLKFALARMRSEVTLGEGIPVLHLSGGSRADLRAIESCPRHL